METMKKLIWGEKKIPHDSVETVTDGPISILG